MKNLISYLLQPCMSKKNFCCFPHHKNISAFLKNVQLLSLDGCTVFKNFFNFFTIFMMQVSSCMHNLSFLWMLATLILTIQIKLSKNDCILDFIKVKKSFITLSRVSQIVNFSHAACDCPWVTFLAFLDNTNFLSYQKRKIDLGQNFHSPEFRVSNQNNLKWMEI